ncbi:DUF1294 domain-containing protein [Sulfurimonas sp. SAG-AH-194-L11]|nr:DUF1294 domain-containing protein [Sulfurimonas sp. SAG-AH-194-L11]MDF1877643.1 DUF1294 domain-containing protein [Sulfurimonas sp. SAG-AH-194-L11]
MLQINFTLTYFEVYLIIVSTFSFALYAYDKLQSLKNTQNISRISERNLLISSFIGGTFGSLISMFVFRHKIKKPSFIIKFSIVVIIQLALIYLYVYQNDLLILIQK